MASPGEEGLRRGRRRSGAARDGTLGRCRRRPAGGVQRAKTSPSAPRAGLAHPEPGRGRAPRDVPRGGEDAAQATRRGGREEEARPGGEGGERRRGGRDGSRRDARRRGASRRGLRGARRARRRRRVGWRPVARAGRPLRRAGAEPRGRARGGEGGARGGGCGGRRRGSGDGDSADRARRRTRVVASRETRPARVHARALKGIVSVRGARDRATGREAVPGEAGRAP